MNSSAFAISSKAYPSSDLNHLVIELDHYVRRSERLSLINELHKRLAGTIDMPSMVEAFSIWLMPLFEHELLGYNNPRRGRCHLFCSCHGPERSTIRRLARINFSPLLNELRKEYEVMAGYKVYRWRLGAEDEDGLLVLLQKGETSDTPLLHLMDEALSVLSEALRRALDYEDLFEQARRDALTGLANRRVFEDRIHPLMESARRNGSALTLASMDLDGFKNINDTLGHAAGDSVLQRVARTLEEQVRSCDLLVRMGGDEFLLVLPGTALGDAEMMARRLKDSVRNLNVISADGKKLGISIGLIQWKKDRTLSEWLDQADAALYEDKGVGR